MKCSEKECEKSELLTLLYIAQSAIKHLQTMAKNPEKHIPSRFRATFQAREGAMEQVLKILWAESGIKNRVIALI